MDLLKECNTYWGKEYLIKENNNTDTKIKIVKTFFIPKTNYSQKDTLEIFISFQLATFWHVG